MDAFDASNNNSSEEQQNTFQITVPAGEAWSERIISEPGKYRVTAETESGESDSVEISLSTGGKNGDELIGGRIEIFIQSDGNLQIAVGRD